MKADTTKILATSKFGLSLGFYDGKYYLRLSPTAEWIEIPTLNKNEAVLYFNHKCDEASRGPVTIQFTF